jgi:hypothetical protein
MFQEEFVVIDNKPVETHKKPKRTKVELQRVLNNRKRALMGSPQTMEKGKNIFDIGEGSKQINKLGEYVDQPQKYLKGSMKPFGVAIIGVVTQHVPSKPKKEIDSI